MISRNMSSHDQSNKYSSSEEQARESWVSSVTVRLSHLPESSPENCSARLPFHLPSFVFLTDISLKILKIYTVVLGVSAKVLTVVGLQV